MNPIWVLVNCNSLKEGEKLGKAILEKRSCSCFDIFDRKLTQYFWPHKSGKIESAKGCLLIIETLEEKYSDVASLVKKLHSDQLPFIGYIEIKGTDKKYKDWIEKELS